MVPFGTDNRCDPRFADKWRIHAIFIVSVLALFLEMIMIRWIGTEVRIFAYLQNTILVVCFLGLGVGCFTSRQPVLLRRNLLIPLLVLLTLLAIPFTRAGLAKISAMLSVLSDFLIWNQGTSQGLASSVGYLSLGLALTLVLMILLWEMFVPLGRLLGRMMEDHPHTIRAYSANILGSMVGIWMFVGLSTLYAPPWVWIAVAVSLMLPLLGKGRELKLNLACCGVLVLLSFPASWEYGAHEVIWSPYQKLTRRDNEDRLWEGQFLEVNNVGYQEMIDLRPESVEANRHISSELHGLSQYDIPLLMHEQPERVLIVGAGSGNDAAGALRNGAESITAVEIDPAIIELGRRHHPERPYDSPRVNMVNDDARSFFARSTEHYDVIIFGLLDSHTTTSMTNARLDHYVYTVESLERAKSLLAPDGVLVLSFEATKPYIADRMGGALSHVFGRAPLTFRVPASGSGWGGVIFVTGDQEMIQRQLAVNPKLARQIAAWQLADPVQLTNTIDLATDDWPYIYLETPHIPTLYYLLAGLMAGLMFYAQRRTKMPGLSLVWSRTHWHFFFLGAAFLLLEVQNISKAAVVLGNTWSVNAVIISAILAMILAANYLASRFPRLPQGVLALCLIASCIGLYGFDLSRLAGLPYATKVVLVGLLTTSPMLFAGIIFIRSFAAVERKDLALGANLIGSVVGGLLQSITFVVGIKGLLLTAAALYVAALVTRPSGARSGVRAEDDDNIAELSRRAAADKNVEVEQHTAG